MILLLLGLACTGKQDAGPAPVDSGDGPDTQETGETDTYDTAPPDGDGDGVSPPTDCDDDDPSVNPAAMEICNGMDDDCDGLIDDLDPDVQGQDPWYADADEDSFGGEEVRGCEQPAGAVTSGGDCDDTDAGIWPGALEDCDGVDQDCDALVDDGCTTAPVGELEAADAQFVLAGPCAGSYWGAKVVVEDLGDDGLADVIDGAWCDEVKNLLAATGPIDGVAPDPDASSVLRLDGDVEYLHNFDSLDIDGDGRHDLVTTFFFEGFAGARLFRTPTLGMVPDDADLTLTEASGENYGGVKVAAIPGSSAGALVISATWWDSDYQSHGTWVVDADESGEFTTADLPSLGPEGSYAADYSVPRVNDAGDVDGDGDHELFFGGGEALDIYLGPVTQSTGAREPDIQLAAIYTSHEDYTGYTGIFKASADIDGDGLDDPLVRGYDESYTIAAALGRSDGLMSLDGENPVLVCPDLECDNVTPLDVDGDGHIDLAVGVPEDDSAAEDAGLVYLEYGPFAGVRELGGEGNAVILGAVAGQQFGYAAAGGDTNGDGFDDLAVGMLSEDETEPGNIWVFLGGP